MTDNTPTDNTPSDKSAEVLKEEAIKYRQQKNEARLEADVLKECIKHKIDDYEAVMKLLPTEQLSIKDGQVQGLPEAMESLKTKHANLFGKTLNNTEEDAAVKKILRQASASPQGSGTEKYKREDIKSMSVEQINANWKKISEQLKENSL